jgi:hypothetical protein
MGEFVGAIGIRAHTIEAIRSAFVYSPCTWHGNRTSVTFDVTKISGLQGFHYGSFAEWVREFNAKEIPPEKVRLVQFYVVNYLLCPNSEDEFEVEALVREVFGETGFPTTRKQVAKIGRYTLFKEVQ